MPAGASHVQITHRVLAYGLFFHVIGISMAIGRRGSEAPPVKRAAKITAGLVLLQLAIGAAMVMSMLPAGLRSLHQAVGIAVWLSMFLATYLARTAARTADVAVVR
jgi:heme A synthase